MENCDYCHSKVKNENYETYLASSFGIIDMKTELLQLRKEVKTLKEENSKLTKELTGEEQVPIINGKIEDLKLEFKNACKENDIKLTLDMKGSRVRYSFKSEKTKKYRRINFVFNFDKKILFGRVDQLVKDLTNWIIDGNWEQNSNGWSYGVKYLNFKKMFLIYSC